MTKQDKKNYSFTNSTGDTFKLFPLNPLEREIIQEQLEAEWKAAGKVLPELPSYEVKSITGETQRVQVDSREKAEQAGILEAWEAYVKADNAFNQEFGNRFMVSLFLCVDADPEDFPRWKTQMRLKKITIPEDEGERLLLFGKTWVIRSTDDLADLTFAVTSTMGSISEEAREAAQSKFRALLEEAANRQVTSG